VVDPSSAALADGQVRARVDEVLDRVGLDVDDLPSSVVERLAARTRHPESRLTVGRYVVVGELGRGGMGVVYEAWDPGIDRRVAIKTIEPDLVPEEEREEVIERFKREVKVVGRLHHPAIVTIHDSGMERELDPVTNRRVPSLYYYVMEYLDGRSLARVLREEHRLEDDVAVTIAADIAEALQLSHDGGIIHRDIKPSNIFLRGEREAVLLDFGIAKTGSVALTRQGQILGTPSYLAPERLREKEIAIDGRADIFSLGVLLFTMLTGEAPFVGEDVYEVIDKIAKASHPKLGRDTPSGQALSQVIDRMLAKDPAARYATAGEAAQALRHVQSLFFVSDAATPRDLEEEATSERETTSPSAPTPLAPHHHADDEDTGRVAAPPPEETEAEHRLPARPPSAPPETELLENAVQPPPMPTKVTPPPLPRPSASDVDAVTSSGISDGETEIAPSHREAPVRVADVLGTRPELALQRETRELMPGGKPQIADLIAEELEPSFGPMPGDDTSPSLAVPLGDSDKTADGEPAPDIYASHSLSNDESTDEGHDAETVADPSRRVPSNIRNAPLRSHQGNVETEQVIRAQPAKKKRSSRIEASLVDEDDVVVKPAPLEALKPDELPTQTGFQLPKGGEAPVVTGAPVTGDVVRARGDSQVQDPAEANPTDVHVEGVGREIELDPGSGSMPELDVPRSAAVARKTFGTDRAPNAERKRPNPVQVRVTGKPLSNAPEDRMRMIRRRGILLLSATLASVAIGLFLGRLKQPSPKKVTYTGAAETAEEGGPKIAPRVVTVNSDTMDPPLQRPRAAKEQYRDAVAARASNHLEDAVRLYAAAVAQLDPSDELHAEALLGYADALRDTGDNAEAIKHYRELRRLHSTTLEADKAKVALAALGAWRPRRADPPPAPPPSTEPKRSAPAAKLAPVENKKKTIPITDDMTPNDKCVAILRNHLDNNREAVRALEALEGQHPNASCVYWNLGRKYEKLSDLRAALDAYKRFLVLAPKSQKRGAVEARIEKLEAKLRH
jgi:serine/threonine protein kinase